MKIFIRYIVETTSITCMFSCLSNRIESNVLRKSKHTRTNRQKKITHRRTHTRGISLVILVFTLFRLTKVSSAEHYNFFDVFLEIFIFVEKQIIRLLDD